MSHPLSSAQIDFATTHRGSPTSRRSSDGERRDLDCVAQQSPDAGKIIDIEKADSPELHAVPLSPKSMGKQRVHADSTGFSAIRASQTAAATRPKGDGELDGAWKALQHHDFATSPLHVDMRGIPPIHAIPHLTNEGTITMDDAYNMGHVSPANEESDPLLLRSRMVNTDQELRRRPSKGRRADGRVRNYYERQNTLIENLLKPIAKHASDDQEEAEAANKMVRFLIYLNIVANFALAGLQLFAAISSLSLSLFATAADSVFDPFANVLLNWLHVKSKRLDERKWPIGGSRIENAGNIAYACIMGCVSVVLIVESARDIGSHKPGEINTLYVPSLIAVGIAFVTKLILGVLNYSYRKHSSQLDMLWVDCRNDMFINGFGIFTSAAGAKIVWWLDPAGAIIISFGIIFSWSRAAYEQFRELCGAAAPVEFLQLCTYNALHIHYQHIEMIDSVKAYHSGPKYVVEVDIVMKPDTPLWLSHNVSQDLQDKIEQLPLCERAFVHVDFEVDHRPEHQAATKKVK